MTDELTTGRVAALLAEATPGPWVTRENESDEFWFGNGYLTAGPAILGPSGQADAALVAASHDIAEAYIAQAARIEALESAAQPRNRFPILGGGGAKVDWQLVADHGQQAKANHYQSVERLAKRGGLSWVELHAVLFNRPFQKMDTNEAMIACRELEARYLAALTALRDKPSPAVTVQEAARVLLDQPYGVMSAAFDAMEKLHGEGADRIMAAALRAIAGGGDE